MPRAIVEPALEPNGPQQAFPEVFSLKLENFLGEGADHVEAVAMVEEVGHKGVPVFGCSSRAGAWLSLGIYKQHLGGTGDAELDRYIEHPELLSVQHLYQLQFHRLYFYDFIRH